MPAATGLAVGTELAPAVDGWRRAKSWDRVLKHLDRPVRIRADAALPVRPDEVGQVAGPGTAVELGRFWPGVIVVGRGYVALCHRAPRRSLVVRGGSLRALDAGPRTEWGWNSAFAGDVRLPDRMARIEDDHGTYAVIRVRHADVALLDDALSESAEFAGVEAGRQRLLPLAGYPRIWLVMTALLTLVFWLAGAAAALEGAWDVLLGAAVITALALAPGLPWMLRSLARPWRPSSRVPISPAGAGPDR